MFPIVITRIVVLNNVTLYLVQIVDHMIVCQPLRKV